MTARVTADAVDAVLHSRGTCESKLDELREMVSLARRLDAPPRFPGVVELPLSQSDVHDPRD